MNQGKLNVACIIVLTETVFLVVLNFPEFTHLVSIQNVGFENTNLFCFLGLTDAASTTSSTITEDELYQLVLEAEVHDQAPEGNYTDLWGSGLPIPQEVHVDAIIGRSYNWTLNLELHVLIVANSLTNFEYILKVHT